MWFLANSVDGELHWNPREGKISRRSAESITSWRYVVIESDSADPQTWLRALVQFPLPIAAVYTSGQIHSRTGQDQRPIRRGMGPGGSPWIGTGTGKPGSVRGLLERRPLEPAA